MLANRFSGNRVDVPAGKSANKFMQPNPVRVADNFIVTLTASGSATTADYALLFDDAGAVAGKLTLATTAEVTAVGTTLALGALKAITGRNAIYIEALNYQTNGTHGTIEIIKVDADGSYASKSISPFMAKRNTQEQTNLLTIPVGVWVDAFTAIKIPISQASEVVVLGFFVGGQANRVS
jgi:stage V sporulation protein SpoVS